MERAVADVRAIRSTRSASSRHPMAALP
jgi:hypothetical protein